MDPCEGPKSTAFFLSLSLSLSLFLSLSLPLSPHLCLSPLSLLVSPSYALMLKSENDFFFVEQLRDLIVEEEFTKEDTHIYKVRNKC